VIVSFEPLPEAHAALVQQAAGDAKWIVAPRMALGQEESMSLLHVSANSVSSSLLDMADAHTDAAPDSVYVREEIVPVRRLDQILPQLVQLPLHPNLFLKIDVQGFELPVMLGAAHVMENVRLLHLELSFIELYSGQWLFEDAFTFLSGQGLRLWDMWGVFRHPRSGRLLQVDGLFIREPQRKSANVDPGTRRQVSSRSSSQEKA
jgi:FkbM family methyltransferase